MPAFALLREELEKRLFYVGPLRSAPQRSILRQSVIGLDVGSSRESAVQLLYNMYSYFAALGSLSGNASISRACAWVAPIKIEGM